MIAIDASTAVQSFRDGVYDIAELGEKLQALLESDSGFVSFKYADGSVVSMPSAALVQAMVPTFAQLLIGGAVVLEPKGGELLVRSASGDGALEALVATHEAENLSIEKSRIVELVISGSLSIKDFSAWAATNGLVGKVVVADRVSGASTATTTFASISSVYVSEGAAARTATFRSEWATSPVSSATGLVAPSTIGFYDDATKGTVEIALTSGSMQLNVPSRDPGTMTTTIHCAVPYHTPAGWEYLEVDSYSVEREDSPHTEAARGAMTKFLLWPNWKMEGSTVTERTFRVYPGGPMTGEAPIVRVRNTTAGTLQLPHVWAFTKQSNGKGAVAAVAYVKLPPYSCEEFEFRHNEIANCGYLYPLSIW